MAGRDDDTPRPRRRLRIVVLLLLVPLVALPLVAVVVHIVGEVSALMGKPAESAPETIDPVVMLHGTALANQLRAELGSTDIAVARFVGAVASERLATVVPGAAPCAEDDLRLAVLSMPSSAKDNVSYRVRVSAPGEQVDPGSLAGVAVDLEHAITHFEKHPTDWNLRTLRRAALELHTIVFVVAVRTPAALGAQSDSFAPGTLRGTGYVYSARENRIRCAGAIDITNRDSVRFQYRSDMFAGYERRAAAEQALAEDLDDQLLIAIHGSLHAVSRTTAPR
jgi:hypothetical protein